MKVQDSIKMDATCQMSDAGPALLSSLSVTTSTQKQTDRCVPYQYHTGVYDAPHNAPQDAPSAQSAAAAEAASSKQPADNRSENKQETYNCSR